MTAEQIVIRKAATPPPPHTHTGPYQHSTGQGNCPGVRLAEYTINNRSCTIKASNQRHQRRRPADLFIIIAWLVPRSWINVWSYN